MKCLCLSLLLLALAQCLPQLKQECHKGALDDDGNCHCENHRLFWPPTGGCYEEFTAGPCARGEQIVLTDSGKPECRCLGFWLRWKDGKCYREFTRGPCAEGDLLIKEDTKDPECKCSDAIVMHYFPSHGKCYAIDEQGPCPEGHVVKFDFGSLKPFCKCKEQHALESDGNCYELNSVDHCNQTDCVKDEINCYLRNLDTLKTECKCLPNYLSTSDGHCYEQYSRGPCGIGNWFVSTQGEKAVCMPKEHCSRFDNWFYWSLSKNCYRQYTQGPCKAGELFYMSTKTGIASCNCEENWKPYYWQATGSCYEQQSVGPCPEGMYFAYNSSSGDTECRCFTSHILDQERGVCFEKMTLGPCPFGKLVSEDPTTGTFSCQCSPAMTSHYWNETGLCYEHYLKGPCNETYTFRLDPAGSQPMCIPFGRK